MEQSQSIKELASALAKFQAEVETIKKDATNPYFKSKYASLENIVEGIRIPLSKNGLSFSQFPTGDNELTTILMHISGEFLKSTVKMNPKKDSSPVKQPDGGVVYQEVSPQAQGSAITYMRRYAISSITGIVTDEDDDGNVASGTGKTEKTLPTVTTPPKVAKTLSKNTPQLVLKKKINDLVKEIGVPDMNKDNAQSVIKSLVDLDLVEENYEKIVDRLQAILNDKNEQEGHVKTI